MELFPNPHVQDGAYPVEHSILSEEESTAACDEISRWEGFTVTPLVSLQQVAKSVGVRSVFYKDESERFGLGSFKALGGSYAVFRLLRARVALLCACAPEEVTAAALMSGKYAKHTAGLTACCATDGNHGRSVAWGARVFGCRCVIYIHEDVSAGREAAIAAYGAEVVRNEGNYDAAVLRAAEDADRNGWVVVSDTSWSGYEQIPADVVHGYTVMVAEAVDALPLHPTHVFVQGGVGGLAAAVVAKLWWTYQDRRPTVVVVEPLNAACLLESARAGKAVLIDGTLSTIMAGLACGEPSAAVWPLLSDAVHFFLKIADDSVVDAMRLLATPTGGDVALVGGESGVAGLAGLRNVAEHAALAAEVGLTSDSVVLLFGTEGNTDVELYEEIVGKTAAEVKQSGFSESEAQL